jgi:hypothetical protein
MVGAIPASLHRARIEELFDYSARTTTWILTWRHGITLG